MRDNSETNKQKASFKINDFAIELRKLIMPENHLWVNSGYTTVHPLWNQVTGIQGFFSPPYALPDFSLLANYRVNGLTVMDNGNRGKGDVGLLYGGGTWYPDRIVRKGTYHHIKDKKLISFSVVSELIPCSQQNGFLLKINITNRCHKNLIIEIIPLIDPGSPYYLSLDRWQYSLARLKGEKANKINDTTFGNSQLKIHLSLHHTQFKVQPGATQTAYLTVLASNPESQSDQIKSPVKLEQLAVQNWKSKLHKYSSCVPVLDSTIPGLKEYYQRCLVSGLVCIWENPAFQNNPHVATSGMDGGALCSYLWDIGGYAPNMLIHMLKEQIIPIIKQFLSINLSKYYAFTPDGKGTGVRYSYSPWSLIKLVWSAFCHLEPELNLYQQIRDFFLAEEQNYTSQNELFDYGTQENLLEMRSTGWEHFVASPNAERAWCYQRLAELGSYFKETDHTINSWKKMGQKIIEAIENRLWAEKEKWFYCLYPDHHRELIYSIQAFDTAGICSDHISNGLFSHLNDKEFLGSHGVHSISPQDDIHFELNDPDWSGGGAYSGESPQLVQKLFQNNRPELAIKILKRLFWMGCHLPYIPQEHFADKPGSPSYKRANVIAGLAGAEAIIYGLFGLELDLDGTIWMNPHPIPGATIKLENYQMKNRNLSFELQENSIIIRENEKTIYCGEPAKIKI
ncbi:MAG: hypothetical protein MJB14_15895 [Spirochaetes bacterium]|nr:hypothetical protein [Spirochaetota bacterium]